MRSFFFLFLIIISGLSQANKAVHAIAKHGKPKYAEGFSHFDYVNPNAIVGGKLRVGIVGTFDSLNHYVMNGVSAHKLHITRSSLMGRSADEPFSVYGVVAESVELAEDRTWIIYNLRPEAKWDTGDPITADDIIFSYKTWLDQGHAFMKTFYRKIKKVEKLSPRKVKFTFKTSEYIDRELPLIMGIMPLIPQKYYEGKRLEDHLLDPLIPNGPYKITKVRVGKSITFKRRPEFWGWQLPNYKGRYNFDEIELLYFRNKEVMYEAFLAGDIDYFEEKDPSKWHTQYIFDSDKSKKIKKAAIEHYRPVGMTALVFNTRRDIFKNTKVRQAIAMLYDFDWVNKTLFHGEMTRTKSFFVNTELESGKIISKAEQELLDSYEEKINPKVYQLPVIFEDLSDDYKKREVLKKAKQLLGEAGWIYQSGRLINKETGEPFTFNIVLPITQKRKIALGLTKNLQRLGIYPELKILEISEYEQRRIKFDYDMAFVQWAGARSPGNEIINYISSKVADINGSRNYPGIKDPVIDDLIVKLITAPTWDRLVTVAKVIDRILLTSDYMIPLFYNKKDYVAYWNRLQPPNFSPGLESRIESWWVSKKSNPLLKKQQCK
jgi:microcin C transport system substrate-binding protein